MTSDSVQNRDMAIQTSTSPTTQEKTLEVRAVRLAESHSIREQPVARRLLNRLKTQRILLHDAYLLFVRLSETDEIHSYAAEWLLDNYYIVQQAMRQIEEDMPEKFYRQLPKLGSPRMAGFPRVYAIALDLVNSSDARIDTEQLDRFISAYQTISPLTMGEIWALPVMLRFSIIEVLSQATTRILDIQTLDEGAPGDVFGLDGFAAGVPYDTIVANCIISLRALAIYDWKVFFERSSLVERILEREPSKYYIHMDFESRDQYRKVIEKLSRRTGLPEIEVARRAVRLARDAEDLNGQSPRRLHVGYYLVDQGLRSLEKSIGYRPEGVDRLVHGLRDHALAAFLGAIGLVTFVFLLILYLYVAMIGASGWQIVVGLILGAIPALSIAVGLVNWLVTTILSPRQMPKLDFSAGIPDENRGLVVIPALLTGTDEVDSLVEQLEVHYLRNQDPNLAFALLTDFTDAPEKTMPGDVELLDYAVNRFKLLQERYRENGENIFLFMHRERKWNPAESVWMGWERKRGKLEELNHILTGTDVEQTSYTTIVGNLESILPIRYVITLDADTLLPQGSAARLIGAMAHPLSIAEFQTELDGARSHHVVAGYTVLQPRTEIKPTSAWQTRFTTLFAGDTGLDLYTHSVSDVYQDLLQEGIYVGKGIYDVRAFSRCLKNQIPDNTLLSHDLLEGLIGRAGLVTDIILFEDYPSHYLGFIRRMHRWIRGDWQLLPWLFTAGPNAGKDRLKLSLLDRWKILDNLRRSLNSPFMLLLLLLGWTWLPGSPLFWTFIAVVASAAPVLTGIVNNIYRRRKVTLTDADRPIELIMTQGRQQVQRWLLSLVFLPYEAFVSLSAIGVTLLRVLVTRKKMLEWTPSAAIARFFGETQNTILIHWLDMIVSPILALAAAMYMALTRPGSLLVAAPFLVAWLVAPQIAAWLDRPTEHKTASVTQDQQQKLRTLARRTWFFFEQFVGPSDHWLPPDHFQETPRGTVAHRTSTTNIGLGMLSALAAYDFGYTGLQDLITRQRNTLDALDQLEMYRGHFLNWYDTSTLASLPPRYVSTVDSGNLVASFVTLRLGLHELPEAPLLRWQNWEGLLDTLTVFSESVMALEQSEISDEPSPAIQDLMKKIDGMREKIISGKENPIRWGSLLDELTLDYWQSIEQDVVQLIEPLPSMTAAVPLIEFDPAQLRSVRLWAERIRHSLSVIQREQRDLVPWVRSMANPPDLFEKANSRSLLGQTWHDLQVIFMRPISLKDVQTTVHKVQGNLDRLCTLAMDETKSNDQVQEAIHWCNSLREVLPNTEKRAALLLEELENIDYLLSRYISEMDFRFLYDQTRNVFHIGYNLDAQRMDANYYDLLSSEARIASLMAIAKGDVPLRHWLYLARPLTRAGDGLTLLSWSGTMFEYLMPSLFTHEYPNTLLNESSYNAVRRQIDYGNEKGVPWGISESGFFFFDNAQNYQYRAFGVPGLGLKRGLSDDLVITPYASLLALPFAPSDVMANLDRLDAMRILADYGYYEAIDYTPDRLTLGQEYAVVRSFMAHHQGMILLQIANFLQGSLMVNRFHRSTRIQSVDLLLQEQVPQEMPLERIAEANEEAPSNLSVEPQVIATSWRLTTESGPPRVHYLSNGHFGTLVTNRGGGYSRWEDSSGAVKSLTRWRADSTLDDWGPWVYLQDLQTGVYWTAAWQVPPPRGGLREVFFAPHRADFNTSAEGLNLNLQITVSPDDDLEIRWIRVSNSSDQSRTLALTSYGEVVLTAMDADRRHPAFNKMVIESEFIASLNALVFRRRPRSASDTPVFLVHSLVSSKASSGRSPAVPVEYESSRLRFLGRGRTSREPLALEPGGPGLTGMTGYVLDPIFSIRHEFIVGAHESFDLAFLTIAASSRQKGLNLARRYSDWNRIERVFDHARYTAEIEMRRMDINSHDIEQYQTVLSTLLYPQPGLRANPDLLSSNVKGQPALWSYGISGDYPILLVKVGEREEITLVRELLRAHTYWRSRGLQVYLVIFNDKESGYSQEVNERIFQLLQRTYNDSWLNRRGGIFLLRKETMDEEDQVLLQTVARAVFDSGAGSFEEQLARLQRLPVDLPGFSPVGEPSPREPIPPVERPAGLLFDNGWGGFSPDGKEYRIYLEPGRWTPAPWINVIANEHAGFWVSEAGGGYTWAENSGENRLTPWSNDPVGDAPGEAIYLRDEETSEVWSPTPLPAGEDTPFLIRHGAGYTIFEHHSHGLRQALKLFVPRQDPLKIAHLTLENRWDNVRRITVTYYAEWVLGVNRDQMAPYIIPEYENSRYALLARNPYQVEFADRVAFLSSSKEPHGLTASRFEFLGRWGSYRRPVALERVGLSGEVRAGMDPCAAIQIHIDLQPGETQEVFFLLGQGAHLEDTLQILDRYQHLEQVQSAFEDVTAFWDDLLSTVQVSTPDPAVDLILNRWLLYQDLSCRVWGRSALYQSSGAYGFRDQLQDVMALVHTAPEIAREQILRSARHQFEQGDVLHWWHPPSGRGVRTRHSDDMLWLPFVVTEYLESTGDRSILTEKLPFKVADELHPEEEDRYGDYPNSNIEYSLYEHCRRAILRGSTSGPHGIPLIGAGDWNDGMNRVGVERRGESIWLGWFLYAVLQRFAPVSRLVGEEAHAEAFLSQAQRLRTALQAHGWDGTWYLRGYYDSGQPLGSAQSMECKIDAIAQSWALISGAGQPERDRQAMQSVLEQLVQEDGQLLRLFTPPFNRTPLDPGYIKAYPPGVRENGGQYTHAATWTVWAFTLLGKGDQAGSLYRMINPVYHGDSPERVEQYKVEPYVIAADVYSEPPHVGHGGWTWYTGSAGWMYRLGLEAILGLHRVGDRLVIDPCVPADWQAYQIDYRFGGAIYQIRVENPGGAFCGVSEVTLDGIRQPELSIPLQRDGEKHVVIVYLDPNSPRPIIESDQIPNSKGENP